MREVTLPTRRIHAGSAVHVGSRTAEKVWSLADWLYRFQGEAQGLRACKWP